MGVDATTEDSDGFLASTSVAAVSPANNSLETVALVAFTLPTHRMRAEMVCATHKNAHNRRAACMTGVSR